MYLLVMWLYVSVSETKTNVFPLKGFNSLKQLTKLSKLDVPQYILDALMPIKADDEAVRAYGVKQSFEMCKKLLQSGLVSEVV